jgi:5-hydroxyisourate hydrolase-like protein (transthyretin family)
MRAFILVAMMGARLSAQPAGIDGTVIDETTGKPVERVHVTFIGAETYGAMSDAAGHFSIAQMAAGQYRLGLDRTGYMQVTDDRGVRLKAGQQISDLTVRMALASMVTGHVLDQYGDPVADMNVRLQPLPPAKLSPSMTQGEYSQTDDRGEFHIVTAPGKYYLSVEPQPNGQNGPPEVRTDGTSEPAYGLTYYPNALAKERASIVEVTAGRNVEALEIRLAAAAVQRRFNVRGRVSGGPANAVGAMVSVEGSSEHGMTGARVDGDGKFLVSGLTSGPYVIVARCEMNQKPQAAWARFNLDNGDVTGLELVLRDPGELMGTLVIAGGTAGKKVRLDRRE